jgi:site-specific recombinase XerD
MSIIGSQNVPSNCPPCPTVPELEQSKASVLATLPSLHSRRSYGSAIGRFVEWYCSELRLGFNRSVIFRQVRKNGSRQEAGVTVSVVWDVVKQSAKNAGIAHLAPHDLRRSCARLCHESGGELEQIQFLLGHASVLTTERYLGFKQN